MSDHIEGLRNRTDPFSNFFNIQIDQLAEGYAKIFMRITKNHLNFYQVAHGGAIYSLADQAFALASNSHGVTAVAIQMNIHYHRPSKLGDILEAEARQVHFGKRVAVYQINVKNRESNKLIASCQGMVYHIEG
ncbi:MAG: PaaI family thioesterase [Promethearchaeota archaeon]